MKRRTSKSTANASAPAANSAAPSSDPTAPVSPPSLLTRPLGLLGWDKLEPVLLAALATAEPLLLIGGHGTAKKIGRAHV